LKNGITWNAERDSAEYPYIIAKNKKNQLVRMPVTLSDWPYKADRMDPADFYKVLTNAVDHIAKEKIFGSICFHPWVHGEDPLRLEVFKSFLKYASQHTGIRLLTFGQMRQLCLEGFRGFSPHST
jgi:hypothetical protein